jgi:hypothetical protein
MIVTKIVLVKFWKFFHITLKKRDVIIMLDTINIRKSHIQIFDVGLPNPPVAKKSATKENAIATP